jgi:hypothetical protein
MKKRTLTYFAARYPRIVAIIPIFFRGDCDQIRLLLAETRLDHTENIVTAYEYSKLKKADQVPFHRLPLWGKLIRE